MAQAPDTDSIIQKVKELNAGYNNTNYAKGTPLDVGGGKLHPVTFINDQGKRLENYVFERGELLKPYWTMRDFIVDNSGIALPSLKNIEFLKVVVVSILTFIFAISVVCIVVWRPENKSLQILTGLLGLTLGYFVGRTERT